MHPQADLLSKHLVFNCLSPGCSQSLKSLKTNNFSNGELSTYIYKYALNELTLQDLSILIF